MTKKFICIAMFLIVLACTLTACKKDGIDENKSINPTIEINDDGFWVINGVKTEHKAEGKDGANGIDGVSPTVKISTDGFWVINGMKTEHKASCPDNYNEMFDAFSEVIVKDYEKEKIYSEITRGLYNGNSGLFLANNGYKCIKFAYDGTSKINVTTYVLANAVTVACFYDSNDTLIGSTGLEKETKWITDYTLSIPEHTAYIALNCRYTGSEEPEAFVVTGESLRPDYSKMLKDKKIVNFGDSIFGNYRETTPSDKSISALIAESTGATVYNAGFGGCRMGTHDTYWNDFSMNSLANAIATGDWSAQETAIANQPNFPSYFSETVSMLKNIKWNEIDAITIAYGTNDYKGNVPIADFEESLRYALKTLLSAYPHLKIIVVSPMWRWFPKDGAYSYCSDDEQSKNANGDMLPDFVTACESVAKEFHIPYLDTYYELGINKYNYSYYFGSSDGTHPNLNGRELRANYISNTREHK